LKVLGIDVCTGFCSVALVDDGNTLAAKHEPMTRGHVERLAPMVAEVLTESGLKPTELGGIAVTTGPGSFTGARLGVSFARGLALAANIPTVGVSVFEAMRDSIAGEAVVALPGKNGSILLQRFAPDGISYAKPAEFDAGSANQILPEVGSVTVVGTAAPSFVAMLSDEDRARTEIFDNVGVDAEMIARLGSKKLTSDSSPIPAPLYIRPADAKPQTAVNLG